MGYISDDPGRLVLNFHTGFNILVAAIFGLAGTWQIWVVVAAAIASAIYSAVIYKSVEGFRDDSAEIANETFVSIHSGNHSGAQKP